MRTSDKKTITIVLLDVCTSYVDSLKNAPNEGSELNTKRQTRYLLINEDMKVRKCSRQEIKADIMAQR